MKFNRTFALSWWRAPNIVAGLLQNPGRVIIPFVSHFPKLTLCALFHVNPGKHTGMSYLTLQCMGYFLVVFCVFCIVYVVSNLNFCVF